VTADDLVVVGRIGRPHGLAGEMRAIPTGATLVTLSPGDRIVLAGAGAGERREARIVALRPVDRGVLLRIEGVEIREDAQALTGATISVAPTRLADIEDDDEFYVRDLVGCVVSAGDTVLGPVIEVYPGAANDALVVTTDGGRQLLVPFTKDAVIEVDLPGRRMVIRPDLFGDVA
jgi:16S rRNA processing protein RimM